MPLHKYTLYFQFYVNEKLNYYESQMPPYVDRSWRIQNTLTRTMVKLLNVSKSDSIDYNFELKGIRGGRDMASLVVYDGKIKPYVYNKSKIHTLLSTQASLLHQYLPAMNCADPKLSYIINFLCL